MGEYIPHNYTKRPMKTSEFFLTRPVFALDEATRVLAPPGGRAGTVERLKYHLTTGRLKLVSRGIYAVVPAGVAADRFQVDPFLVAAALRPSGIFSHHSALELLGTAHSAWRQHTLYTEQRRRPLALDDTMISFLEHPRPFQRSATLGFGTKRIERRGQLLQTTGPERTLVEGFRKPSLTGGVEELVRSAAGFESLDLDLLESILKRYAIANLWAAAGWFLEQHQRYFHVPESLLNACEKRRPKSPQYLERNARGGRLAPRWNLILHQSIGSGAADEP